MVNNAIQDLIVAHHGEKIWQQITSKAEVEEELFISTQSYPDQTTYRLVAAASEVLNLPASQVLHQFGKWWVLKTARDNYGHLIRAGGRTISEFLINLPNFHTRIMMIFPHLKPPEFNCTDVQPTESRLHYRSHRQGLSAFVSGLLQGLGEMFEVELSITHEMRRDAGDDHDVFHLKWRPRENHEQV